MQHGVLLFTIVGGFVGQLAKSDPRVPNWIPQAVMVALGFLLYALNFGWPTSSPVEIADWLERALLAAASLPGTASLFSLLPGMKTRQ